MSVASFTNSCKLILAFRVVRFHIPGLEVRGLLVHTANEVKKFDFAKLSRSAFCLRRDIAFGQEFTGALRKFGAFHVATEVGHGVGDDRFAIDVMSYPL